MLRLDLVRLDREKSLSVEADLPPDHALWDETDLVFRGPVRVRLTASLAGSGEVVVRGRVSGELERQCRRCLDEVRVPVEEEVTLVFAPSDEMADDEDGEVRRLPVSATEIDLSEAVREELILATDPFVVCDPGCRGLCPRCGVNRNNESCDCTLDEPDPRWDALRALKNE